LEPAESNSLVADTDQGNGSKDIIDSLWW